MTSDKEITNSKLSKIFSIEFILYAIMTTAAGAAAWTSLASDVDTLQTGQNAEVIRHTAIEIARQGSDVRLARIETNQTNLKEVIDTHILQQRDDSKDQRKEMANILKAIQDIVR